MYEPHIKYLVSSPYGDVSVEKDKWDLPLESDPLKTPYRIYFNSIKNFLSQDTFKFLLNAVKKKLNKEIHLKEIIEIIIRAEKHGAIYHPASIEIFPETGKVKFGLNVAVTDTGKNWLKEEFSVIQELNLQFNLPYIPNVYFLGEFNSMLFLLEDWFEGYHEFHITKDEEGKQRLKLWEFGTGYKYLSYEQSFEIYKQASKIITLYYDVKDFNQIYPWHHAAGDFIVKIENDIIDVRLTTARQYKPLMNFRKDVIDPLFALFYFFLNLSIKMRLDKLDGLGEVVLAEDDYVEAMVKGFIEALKIKEETDNYPELINEFLSLLKSFSREELKISTHPLIDLFWGTGDYPVVIANLDRHVEKIHTILQNLPLQ